VINSKAIISSTRGMVAASNSKSFCFRILTEHIPTDLELKGIKQGSNTYPVKVSPLTVNKHHEFHSVDMTEIGRVYSVPLLDADHALAFP